MNNQRNNGIESWSKREWVAMRFAEDAMNKMNKMNEMIRYEKVVMVLDSGTKGMDLGSMGLDWNRTTAIKCILEEEEVIIDISKYTYIKIVSIYNYKGIKHAIVEFV